MNPCVRARPGSAVVPFVAGGGFHSDSISVGFCFLPQSFSLIVFLPNGVQCQKKSVKGHKIRVMFSSSPYVCMRVCLYSIYILYIVQYIYIFC